MKIKIISFFLFVFLMRCGNYNTSQNDSLSPDLSIQESSFLQRNFGYHYVVEFSGREFYLKDGKRNYTHDVKEVTALLDFLQDRFSFFQQLDRIYFNETENEFFVCSREIKLSENLYLNNGLFSYLLSEGNVPKWLASGIDWYARKQLGLTGIHHLQGRQISKEISDRSFFPGNKTEALKDAIYTSYMIVSYLSENTMLENLIKTMTFGSESERLDTLIFIKDYFFYSHNLTIDLDSRLNFFASPSSIFELSLSSGLKNQITFDFDSFDGLMEIDELKEIVSAIDRAVEWTKDQYAAIGYLPNTDPINFRIFTGNHPQGVGGIAYHERNYIYLYSLGTLHHQFLASVFVHEISHILTSRISIPRFPPFDEGFADYLGVLYALDYRLSPGGTYEIFLKQFYDSTHSFYLETGNDFYLKKTRGLMDAFDRESFNALRVIFMIDNMDLLPSNRGFLNRFPYRSYPLYIQQISSYLGAASFVTYLIETYGIEAYMKIHWRHFSNIEEIIGRSLDELVEGWLSHLREMVS